MTQNPVISTTSKLLQQQFGDFANLSEDSQLKIKINKDLHYIQVFTHS